MLKNKGIKTFIISLILKTSVINYCDFQMDIQTLDYFSIGTSLQEFILQGPPKCPDAFFIYRISANSFCGNYSFLNLALFTVTFGYGT